MSIRKSFEETKRLQVLANTSAEEIGAEVESVGYHEADVIKEERFIPRVDFSEPKNFARYGSAVEYYDLALKNIYNSYPYDGSLKEKTQWENSSSYMDLYIFNERYPRTTGYINFSPSGWGTSTAKDAGYNLPSTIEYIKVKGGPNTHPDGMTNVSLGFTGSNYYDTASNRASNLEYDTANKGVTLEFWLKKSAFNTTLTEKEIIFDLWNGENSSSADYGRLRLELTGAGVAQTGADPFRLTIMSGTTGIQTASVCSSTVTTASVADGNWHHYALTIKKDGTASQCEFYIDGKLNQATSLSSAGINAVTGALRANIGSLLTAVSGTTTPSNTIEGCGKLSASLDEFRYWKTQRTPKDIGRYWFTQVGGGTNTDPGLDPGVTPINPVNTELGVYFKFNEGITGAESIDTVVLDYSGRFSNGSWEGYTTTSRNTGSAMVSSSAATFEFADPIIYSSHPEVITLASQLESSGSFHDVHNNASIYNSIPSWIREEDEEEASNAKYLSQILASQCDNLHIQIESLNKLRDIQYPSGSEKPLPFSNKLLESVGLPAPQIFLDADILEKLGDRSETLLYEKTLNDVKNIIYQNIYNNITYIYKSKGTEKSFRNLIRCYGIDEDLIKFNLYADGIEHELRNNTRNTTVAKRFVDFNTPENIQGTIYQFPDSSNVNSVGFITGSIHLTGGYALTTEVNVVFPLKVTGKSPRYISQPLLTASVFGLHGVKDESSHRSSTTTTWAPLDRVNFQVFAVRDELNSPNVSFVLTSSAGGYIPTLSSSLYEDVYNNTNWNLSVRVRPQKYPQTAFVDGASAVDSLYIVEFQGVQLDAGVLLNQFNVSGTISADKAPAFITGSRRLYAGAHRENFTSSILQYSDIKLSSCRHWITHLSNMDLITHAQDVENYGAGFPGRYPFPFDPSASYGEITTYDTLALNWDFNQNTGSNASGQFTVADFSSGSTALTGSLYGWLGPIVNAQHPASASHFPINSISPIDKNYVISTKQMLPESLQSDSMISILGQEDREVLTRNTRPINYFFSFEKSMYQVISDEIINSFATIRDFHNLIGDPVNRYRINYKAIEKMRQLFFERVNNAHLDFEKFYEFYKWFDSSLSIMLEKLIPASADVAEDVRSVVESHVLERSKYQSKIPLVGFHMDEPEGGLQTILPTSPGWEYSHRPVDGDQKKNKNWWLSYAQRNNAKQTPSRDNPLSSSTDPGLNNSRQRIFNAARKKVRERKITTPYRFDASEGRETSAGAQYHQNKRRDFVFEATSPGGPIINETNIPTNIMLAFAEDIEKLQNVTDDDGLNLKHRLGFTINARINRAALAGYQKADGNILAPFSLYSSSVTTGYNKEIVENLSGGVQITNLHSDTYGSMTDIPLQGPFTQKYVGGREYRHVPINAYKSTKTGPNNIDSPTDRPEGFKLLLGKCHAKVQKLPGALGIVGPRYPDPGSPTTKPPYLYDRPKGNMLRNVGAKRPLNIRNIQQRTGSTVIGNYSRNYEVVNTCGRTQNDPFFNDESFSFALYPETLAVRNQAPLYTRRITNNKSMYMSGATTGVLIGNTATWNALVGKVGADVKPFSVSAWVKKVTDGGGNYGRVIDFGDARLVHLWNNDSVRFEISGSGHTGKVETGVDTFLTDVWNHLVVTYDGSDPEGNTSATEAAMKIYINGNSLATSSVELDGPAGIPNRSFIGNSPVTSPRGFDGFMNDVAIWDRPLPQREVNILFNAKGPVDVTNTISDGLLAWYRMGNASPPFTSTTIDDQSGNSHDGVMTTGQTSMAANAPRAIVINTLNYQLPSRTGSASNQSIIVNRFAGCGYEVMSRGYMTPPHEEYSVYNALPYRNLSVIDYGLSGSASADPSVANTIVVVDQIDKNRGLDQRATLHCGPFGSDAAYGSVPSTTYVTTPSWHKTNRNAKYVRDRIVDDASALEFNGTNAYVTGGNPTDWNAIMGDAALTSSGGSGFSFSVWLKPVSATNGDKILSVGNSTVSGVFRSVEFYGGGIYFDISKTTWRVTNSALTLGTWSHVVGTWNGADNTAPNIYINGVLDNGSSNNGGTALAISSKGGSIGRRSGVSSDYYEGTASNLAVWNTELSADDAVTLYGGGGIVDPGSAKASYLKAWYMFSTDQDDTTSTLHDRTYGELGNLAGVNLAFSDPSGLNFSTEGRATEWNTHATPIYDNLYVQHPIPRSAQQYSWITASLRQGARLHGYTELSGGFVTSLPTITASDVMVISGSSFTSYPHGLYGFSVGIGNSANQGATPVDFVGLRTIVVDPVSSSENTLGFGSLTIERYNAVAARANYINSTFIGGTVGTSPGYGVYDNAASDAYGTGSILNSILVNRNGPYGYPTWKQIRSGENPVVRYQRKRNVMSIVNPPPKFFYQYQAGSQIGTWVQGKKPVTFTQYHEQPISSRYHPIQFMFESASVETKNNIEANVSWANNLDFFSNEGLNSRLNAFKNVKLSQPYSTLIDFTLKGNWTDTSVIYKERVYPRETSAYRTRTRTRSEYTIAKAWNKDRDERSSLFSITGALGHIIVKPDSSMWSLDARLNFSTKTASFGTSASVGGIGPDGTTWYAGGLGVGLPGNRGDGAGELQNSYCRYGNSGSSDITASLSYAMRVLVGSGSSKTDIFCAWPPVYGGDAEWTVTASGEPYENYEDYVANMRLVGKDHTIIPEFRISQHIANVVDQANTNWITDYDLTSPGLFEITGAALADSTVENFYKVYSYTDFMKYFKVVDEDLNNRVPTEGRRLKRKKLQLECSALVKFLPYRGFYPVERTLELGRLFSSSYSNNIYPHIRTSAGSISPRTGTERFDASYRALIEPLMAPGILYNTIKSGIAVGSLITIATTDSNIVEGVSFSDRNGRDCVNASKIYGERFIFTGLRSILTSSDDFNFMTVPFEAIQHPGAYLSENPISKGRTLQNDSVVNGVIWDNGTGNASLMTCFDRTWASTSIPATGPSSSQGFAPGVLWDGQGSKKYELAIDNFLCETVNFFQTPLTTYVSKRENQFGKVVSGSSYAMTLHLDRTTEMSGARADREAFEMYSRASAFGAPYALSNSAGGAGPTSASFAPHLPSYFYGTSSVTMTFTAPYSGTPALADILSNLHVTSQRQMDGPTWDKTSTAGIYAQQVTSSFNILEEVLDVTPGTTEALGRWVIQSKFETPVLNFADVSVPRSYANGVYYNAGTNPSASSKGMWHQYGSLPGKGFTSDATGKDYSGDQLGIFSRITAPDPKSSGVKSLADVVGFGVGPSSRIGQMRDKQTLEEAIVVVPFMVVENERTFFNLSPQTPEYASAAALLTKYIFPPPFDFIKNQVQPIHFYAFEFKVDLTQEDLSKIWQNLPPDVGENFQKPPVAMIEDEKLINTIYDPQQDVQWLVFKVKKAAVKDYNRFRKSLITTDLSTIESSIGNSRYSYNWPYDYFSLVELIKIDAAVEYDLEDIEMKTVPPEVPPEGRGEPPGGRGEPPAQGPTVTPAANPVGVAVDEAGNIYVPPIGTLDLG